jgi:hypothetical protein
VSTAYNSLVVDIVAYNMVRIAAFM